MCSSLQPMIGQAEFTDPIKRTQATFIRAFRLGKLRRASKKDRFTLEF